MAVGSRLSPVFSNFFMEYFEETALECTTHSPLCWFHYVDDTFVIWPHCPGKLLEFLDHLNSVHVETKKEGHLSFLYIDIYYKPDGSLGRKVYHKATHANLYLNFKFHHIHQTNRLYSPHWIKGAGPFVTKKDCIVNWSSTSSWINQIDPLLTNKASTWATTFSAAHQIQIHGLDDEGGHRVQAASLLIMSTNLPMYGDPHT